MIDGKVVAFVHAKGQSTRVPSKNMRELGDRPLFCHAIANALAAESVDTVVIDSDSDEILEIGAAYGAVPLKRPESLANNSVTGDDLAYWQASNAPDSRAVVQVIPTAPFLHPDSIDKAIRKILSNDRDSALAVFEDVLYTWEEGRPSYYLPDGRIPNSFEMVAHIYETTGMYANKTKTVLENRKRVSVENAALIRVSRIEAIDINTEEDFELARIIWRGIQK